MVQDAFGNPQRLVVLGGSSDIARAIAVRLCRERARTVVLAGRSEALLSGAASELREAGATEVPLVLFDAAVPSSAAATVEACLEAAGGPVDLVVLAVGALGDQALDEDDATRALEVVHATYTWPVAALSTLRGRLVAQGTGRILVCSSVAGVRVRRANYLYGGAKAGLDATCVGMAESLRGTGVALQILRPGFVRSKMTRGRPDAPFATDVDAVADVAVAGLSSGRPVLWSPPILRYVFAVLGLLPQGVWRRLPG
jgi:decaprenylphospho-beta-D-erythro-pentofuranosid-2-ulose 2-reductase